MTFEKARRLLEEGKRSCIYRKPWHRVDTDAALTWMTDGTGRGYLFFAASGPWMHKPGPWGGTAEDHEADDRAGIMPDED